MDSMIEAVYENGVLRPLQPVIGLRDGERVIVQLRARSELPGKMDHDERENAFRGHMEKIGLLARWPDPATPAAADFKPIIIGGPPLSQTIIEDRR